MVDHLLLLKLEKNIFSKEIRATRHISPDQYVFLLRSGFDTVEINKKDKDIWIEMYKLDNTNLYYQPLKPAICLLALLIVQKKLSGLFRNPFRPFHPFHPFHPFARRHRRHWFFWFRHFGNHRFSC